MFLCIVLLLFLDMGGVSDHKRSGRLRVMPQVINAVRSRIDRYPVQMQKIMAWEMDIAPRTTSPIIKQDLGLSSPPGKTSSWGSRV